MGEIREELVLADRFTSSFSKFISYGEQAAGNMEKLDHTLRSAGIDSTYMLLSGMAQINQSIHTASDGMREMGDASRYVMIQGLNEINQTMKEVARNTKLADSAQKNLAKSTDRTGDSAKRLLSIAGRIAAAFGGIKIASGLIHLSDTMAQTQARLGMVIKEVDSGLGDVKDLQDMIYQSANRTRGSYLETASAVSKLGLMAGDAFGSSEEIVAFMEQINKQFKIAGTDTMGIQAAMLQLTQAMGAGVLRGRGADAHVPSPTNVEGQAGRGAAG